MPLLSSKDHEEQSTEYNVGQIEEKTIKAPGQVKKISTSIVIDTSAGPLAQTVKDSVTNLVKSATGYDFERGDLISVEGMAFDSSMQKKVEADLKAIQDREAAAQKSRKLMMYIGIPAAAILGLILLLIISSRMRTAARKRKEKSGIDIVIDEPVPVNEIIKRQSILDEADEKESLTSEIRRYANKKPDQIVEIVKSWLVDDER